MKELYEKNKKLFIGITAGALLLCVLIIIFATMGNDKSSSTPSNKEAQVVQTDVTNVKESEEEWEEDFDEVSMEAVTTGALEIVEDSPLDVVEPTQPAVSPSPSPTPSASPGPSMSPGPSASPTPSPSTVPNNMAVNVQYPYEIHVNKQMNCITVYAMDTNGQYSIPLKAMVCSTGAATPLGVYKTPAKYIWKVLKGNVWGQYSTRISGAILFHSVPYSTNSKSALISKYYNKLGTTASAGCVRLTTADAKWIYDNCPLGTTVVIYNDSNPGPLGKPSAIKVPAGNKWDPTDPDPANPWRNKMVRIEGVQNRTIERCSSVDLMAGVTAYDGSGNNITGNVIVSTNADTNVAGVYGVHYTVTDSTGTTFSEDATLTVADTQAPALSGIPGRINGKAKDITRNLLLNGVTASDNGQSLSLAYVSVQIPTLHEGENTVTYVARDLVGNVTTISTIVYCDNQAPVITKRSGAKDLLEISHQLSRTEILDRIAVQDISKVDIQYNQVTEEWGYRIDYTVTDICGNVSSYSDRVRYEEYSFKGETSCSVSDINNRDELKAGITLKNSSGATVAFPATVDIQTKAVNENTYQVFYTYNYSCPVGTKSAMFVRLVSVGE